jgi:hypothetical protein
VAFVGLASAHHGFDDFNQNRIVSVEGTIKRVAFTNPHVVLTIMTKDSQTYTVEWASVYQLSSIYGMTDSTLTPGDTIIVTGSPKRRDVHFLSLLREVRRPSDGWIWSRGVIPPIFANPR